MKRLLLVPVAVIGLIVAGGALASNPAAPHAGRVASPTVASPAPTPRASTQLHRIAAATVRPMPATRLRHVPVAARRGRSRLQPLVVAPVTATLPLTDTADRYLLVDSPAAAPGATVGVRGGGFAPGSTLRIVWQEPGGAALPVAAVMAGRDGLFHTTLTLPTTTTAPAVMLLAQDMHAHGAAATVLSRTMAPLAGLAPNVVTPGQRVSLWVANMRPGETVRVYAGRLAGAPLLTVHAGSDGRGSWPLAIPFGTAGNDGLVVVGDQGRAPVVAPYLLLNLYPHASVSSYAPQPGTHVTFYGGGFAPHEPVELHLDRLAAPVLATATATRSGGLPRLGPYVIPFGLSGAHTFLLHGEASHVTAAVGLVVEPFFASARPSTYAAGPGTLITFYGSGFAPREIVRVYLDRNTHTAGREVASLLTTSAGKLVGGSGSYALPAAVHGPVVHFALVGDISGATAWTSLRYLAPPGASVVVGQTAAYHAPARQHAPTALTAGAPGPVLIATPPRVTAGGRVDLWGTGFRPRAVIHLILTSHDNPRGWALRTVHSGADGSFNAAVTVPGWVQHADAVRAEATAGVARAELAVQPVRPHLTPSTYNGAPGTVYGLAGDGFTPGETVRLYLDSVATPPLAVTTSSGGYIAFDGIHIPVAAAGAHTFVVAGAQGEVAVVPFTVQGFTPFILLSAYSSLPERPVTVTGQGFAPGETVHLFLGAAGGTLLGSASADASGALQATNVFTIPTAARGPLPVVAVGTTSGSAVRATLDVLPFGPSLWLSSYAGHPGATVSFTGAGFARDDVIHVYIGGATTPAVTFRVHDGAFARAGTIRFPYATRGGSIPLTARGALSATKVTLHYLVIPYMPGAGFEIRRRHGMTRLRLGAGGFAPHEIVRYYVGTQPGGAAWRVLRADAQGNLPLLPVLAVRGTPRVRLAYTLEGTLSGTRATARYEPPRATLAVPRPSVTISGWTPRGR